MAETTSTYIWHEIRNIWGCMKRTQTISARLALLAGLLVAAPACVDAPVYSAHLQGDARPLRLTELRSVPSAPAAAAPAPLAAQLGEASLSRPQQYVTLGDAVTLRVAATATDAALESCDVVWRFEEEEVRGVVEIDEATRELRATLPAEATRPGHWRVEVRHPLLAADGPLLRHFEVLRVTL